MTRVSMEQAAGKISGAGTVEAVVSVVQAHLAAWSPSDLARLPENCRPDAVRSVDDIQWYADVFAVECQSGELVGSELQDMCDLFRLASQRVREIAAAGDRSTAST